MSVCRKIGIACFIFLILTRCSQYVFAQNDKNYIVYLNNDVNLLQEDPSQAYSVVDENTLNALLEIDIVEWYEEDFEVLLFDSDETIADPLLSHKWDLTMIDAGYLWNFGCYGESIKTAVIDSGTGNHPDISNNLLEGYNYINSSTDVEDNIGHGTFVNGIISAERNDIGIAGVAPKSKIVPLKCFDVGVKTTVSTICKAIYDAVDRYECDIINMSFGLTEYSKTFENAIDYATDKGCILVASVGNKGDESIYYPASFSNVIGVGAVDDNGLVADFSQRNKSVFVVAPGKGILSTTYTNGYAEKNGTSFSTPMVSGLIAVLLDINRTLSLDEIKTLLSTSSLDCGETGYDTSYGHGIINAKSALNAMLGDEKLFISSIGSDDSLNILNVSESIFDGYLVMVHYDFGIMTNYEIKSVEIPPGSNRILSDLNLPKTCKCFLWKNINNITIISNVTERTIEE